MPHVWYGGCWCRCTLPQINQCSWRAARSRAQREANLSHLYFFSALAGGFCLVATALVVIVQIIARLLGILLPVASEFAGYLLAATIFLTMPYALREGAHVRVTLLHQHLAPRAIRWLEVICLLICLGITIYVAWFASLGVWDSWRFNDRAMGLFATPLWLPKTVLALGFWLTALAMVHRLQQLTFGVDSSLEQSRRQADT